MLIVLSPAKTLDFDSAPSFDLYTQPQFIEQAEYLVGKLKKKSVNAIKDLMHISKPLAELNHQRFQEFSVPFSPENSKQAIFAFQGDVYKGLKAENFSKKDIEYAQKHLRLLSGLYGVLRPLDLMQAYRLEMGTGFEVTKAKSNLYKFWGDTISKSIKLDMENNNDEVLLNLASVEYFKSVKSSVLKKEIIAPEFKEERGGEYKMISFFAKEARGLMAAYVIKNKVNNIEDLKGFDYDGYSFNQRLSENKNKWVFTRKSKL